MADYNSTNTGAVIDSAVDAVELAQAATPTDVTTGRLLKVGDFGLGGFTGALQLTDTESVDFNTFARANSATTSNLPAASNSFNILNMAASGATNTSLAINWANLDAQVLAYIRTQSSTYTSWLELAHEGNNALIEFGSNANGSFTKFPDGTLVCNHALGSASGGESNWSFPSAFIAAPRVQITVSSSQVLSASGRYSAISTTGVTFAVIGSSDARIAQTAVLTAIGRWK